MPRLSECAHEVTPTIRTRRFLENPWSEYTCFWCSDIEPGLKHLAGCGCGGHTEKCRNPMTADRDSLRNAAGAVERPDAAASTTFGLAHHSLKFAAERSGGRGWKSSV